MRLPCERAQAAGGNRGKQALRAAPPRHRTNERAQAPPRPRVVGKLCRRWESVRAPTVPYRATTNSRHRVPRALLRLRRRVKIGLYLVGIEQHKVRSGHTRDTKRGLASSVASSLCWSSREAGGGCPCPNELLDAPISGGQALSNSTQPSAVVNHSITLIQISLETSTCAVAFMSSDSASNSSLRHCSRSLSAAAPAPTTAPATV